MADTILEGNRRVLTGIVVSDKADKTIVVSVATLVKHPLFKKYIRRRKKFMAHGGAGPRRPDDQLRQASA